MNSISSDARPAAGRLPPGERDCHGKNQQRAGQADDQHVGRGKGQQRACRGKDQHAGRSAPNRP